MQQPMQPILQHLFQVSSLDDLSRQRLEAFVEEHPSFGIGHYLLSRKLKAEGSEQFQPETQKTGLYFSNPFWLQWQLEHVAFDGGHQATAVEHEFAAVPWSSPAAEVEEPVATIEEPVATAIPVVEPPTTYEEPVTTVEEPVAAAEPAEPVAAVEEPVAAVEEPTPPANVVTVAEENYEHPDEPSAADQLLRSIEEAKGLRQTLDKINTDFDTRPAAAEQAPETAEPELVAEPAPVLEPAPTSEPAPGEEPIHDEEPPFVLDEGTKPEPETEPIHDNEAPFVLEEADAPVAKAEPESAPVPEAEQEPDALREAVVAREPEPEPVAQASHEPVAAASPHIPTLPGQPAPKDLAFEPYHTIDYFASQGIKFSIDDNPTDKFGRQLKSFTEWLKGMRRLPNKDREVVPDRVAEEAVQTSAAHSVEGKDVVTETMAEVLAKQGMRERAKAVYEKLSLLNPEKRAYFAAKIEQLNIP